ncbi:MAG TPA: nitrogenase iron-molybdenum cofactor biosynthesis protein NifE [Candidatus Acidoferrum sp.]|nr:nitrogenase iron-molybdenum cofactor biosynthesis protein NifE [Candidatus Acidoferrum sp.]
MAIIATIEGRETHIQEKNGVDFSPLACNNESLAGSVSQRACVYSGARVVLNPITDAIHLVHGPIGCASYTWDIRGSSTSGSTLYKSSFSTDMKEMEVIFGGEKKLTAAIRELVTKYNPSAVFVYSTCIVGVIGDDLQAICKAATEELEIPVIPVKSEGFRGNKNEGYKAACNALFELIGTREYTSKKRFTINLLGEYNVAGDLWPIKSFFEEMGIEVIASLTGDAKTKEIQRAHCAQLNLVQCSGSMAFLANKLKERYHIPYKRISFFGLSAMASALRTTAAFFGDQTMTRKAEEIISRETRRVQPLIERHRSRICGKKAAIYMGGAAKAVSLVNAFQELGMHVVIIGTQTGERDDYTKISHIVKDGTVIIDDANPLELQDLLIRQKADILVSGVKERYLAYKLRIAFCDFNHDRTKTFEGFTGMVSFARELDTSINSPVWKLPIERVRRTNKFNRTAKVQEKTFNGELKNAEQLCDS